MAKNKNTSITINFKDDSEAFVLEDLLTIEQEEWDNTTGFVTMSNFYLLSMAILSGNKISNNYVSCGLNADGSCTSTIYVYPRVSNLSFALRASFGVLSGGRIETNKKTEIITFNLKSTEKLTYAPYSDVSLEWRGNVYDSEGNITTKPDFSVDSYGIISLDKIVMGTCTAIYTVKRHKYTLRVYPRTTGTDKFGAVVYGVYSNGISWLELSYPPDVDELSSGTISCGGADLDDEEEEEEEEDEQEYAPKVNRKIVYDYCTGELKSDTIEYDY